MTIMVNFDTKMYNYPSYKGFVSLTTYTTRVCLSTEHVAGCMEAILVYLSTPLSSIVV